MAAVMALMGKTALVTGATGFLGGALTRRLAGEGVRVRALARQPHKAARLQGIQGVEIVMGDITDAAQMRAAAAGCHVVFHGAAALRGPLEAQRRVNVEGTRQVIRAAAAAAAERVVHVSTIAVYGYAAQGEVNEDSPLTPGRVPYNISKAEGEAAAREEAARHGLAYSIIRPAMIYGPGSGMWTASLFRLAQRRPVIFIGAGSGCAYPIYVDDVVDLMVRLASHPAAVGEAFNCAPDPAPTWREFLLAYARLAGHERWLGLPPLPLKLAAPLVEWALTLRGEPQDVPALVDFLQGRRRYSMAKARERLGWTPRVTLAEGVSRCAPWLREKGLLR